MSAPDRRLILGTAGHIDHGKTALVRALTGVDTDRLKEEKERGITIDLGFAELAEGDLRLGIVDVPGHEGFIRNMLAGATGMDVVLLVVAADEGVMPQTREHLAIVHLLGVRRMVVALTKCDLVEAAWLELVREEVAELLEPTPLAGAPMVATSAVEGTGLDELTAKLAEVAGGPDPDRSRDLIRMPLDRVFTVRGTGTVATGTLWSGTLRVGDTVLLRPGDLEARVRGLQVHGRDVDAAGAGERTAVALTGPGIDRESVTRGQVLVDHPGWTSGTMVTARVDLLADTAWSLEHNQRVRVHLGTAEVMARTVLLDRDRPVLMGESAWVQLRLEAPALARTREAFVLRSYSPVTTIGGGRIAEALPVKRTRLTGDEAELLKTVLRGGSEEAVRARITLDGWTGSDRALLPVTVGVLPERADAAAREVIAAGGVQAGERILAPLRAREARERLVAMVRGHHDAEPLRRGVAVEVLRDSFPSEAPEELADVLLAEARDAGNLRIVEGIASLPDFRPTLTPAQEDRLGTLLALHVDAGLAPPAVEELPENLSGPDLWPLLRILEDRGELTQVDEMFFIHRGTLEDAVDAVRERLGGREDLGPTDFKEILPVTRRHLIPLLGWMDRTGVTVRTKNGRAVLPA